MPRAARGRSDARFEANGDAIQEVTSRVQEAVEAELNSVAVRPEPLQPQRPSARDEAGHHPATSAPRRVSRADDVREIAAQCTQCGLCNASCPTFVLTGDERDGPRGRITLIAEMFDQPNQAPAAEARRHIGRCLSCMACTTDCPAGVDFGRLIRHAKSSLFETHAPSLRNRVIEWFATRVVPFPRRLRWLLRIAPHTRQLARALRLIRLAELARLAEHLPRLPRSRAVFSGPGTAATKRQRRGRVILLAGCTQQVLRPSINDATIRLLARGGIDVELVAGAGCCGRPASQIGDINAARQFARANLDAWSKSLERAADGQPIDAVIFNSAGCGAEVKNYPELLRDDSAYVDRATQIAALARDVSEFLGTRGLGPPRRWSSLKVAYQAPCALYHGQGVVEAPSNLIHDAGFTLVALPEQALCCGAGGVYALNEPDIANALRERKVRQFLDLRPDVIATGSISCLQHLQSATAVPVLHTVELLDWAHGGPIPSDLKGFEASSTDVPGPPPFDIEDYIRA